MALMTVGVTNSLPVQRGSRVVSTGVVVLTAPPGLVVVAVGMTSNEPPVPNASELALEPASARTSIARTMAESPTRLPAAGASFVMLTSHSSDDAAMVRPMYCQSSTPW
eukprot:Amastigsp_a342767_21.p4 type:complete len:109 gc:universal Amastigsp_a342767_21:1502-1176(-)